MPLRLSLVLLVCVLLALPLASAPSGAQNLPSLGDTEREDLSPLMERKVGEQIMLQLRKDRDYIDDAPVLEYLNDFGTILLSSAPEARGEANYDFFFFAVRDPVLNAFALPGGFIAVHSGLVLAAQNESELASVMSHEIGHVSQRHIARMLGKQRQDSLIPLAAFALAVLTARQSPDAASALMIGGQGLAIQRQLSFNRDAEREADRVGLQILRAANFDTSGMVSFFARMQTATRVYSESVPAFLLSHPLTTERIADIQGRLQDTPYKQRADSLDFHLVRARLRVLQDTSTQGLREATDAFTLQIKQGTPIQIAAGNYGLALIALRQNDTSRAQSLLDISRRAAKPVPVPKDRAGPAALYDNMTIEIRMAEGAFAQAVRAADAARSAHPLSRGIAHQYAQALIADGQLEPAVAYLRDQATLYRQEPQLQELLAKVYSAQGKLALQHLALAESHVLTGGVQAALEQLSIARKAPDATFYDLAQIDARDREMQLRWKEEKKERDKSR